MLNKYVRPRNRPTQTENVRWLHRVCCPWWVTLTTRRAPY